jgi:hypothetical protein
VNRLRARLEDVADTAAPPSRLTADAVYTAAWRRRYRRTRAWTVGGIAIVALVVALSVNASRPPATDPTTPHPDPALTADGWPADTHDGTVISAAATDADHLYAGINACPVDADGRHCTARLVGSDDAGRTWTVRQSDFGDGEVAAPAPGVLLQTIGSVNDQYDGSSSSGSKMVWQPRISTDGGRTWTDVKAVTQPVAQVPAGGWIQCAPGTIDEPCTLLAFDPVTAHSAPLSVQPALDVDLPADVPTSAGLWVTGHERGPDQRPAVAVSLDHGRTWSVHVFGSGEAGFPALGPFDTAEPSSVDGVTGYTIIAVAGVTSGLTQFVYRTVDGGATWHRVNAAQTLPAGNYPGGSYVAADGTHVVLASFGPPQRWYTSGDKGATYRQTTLTGLADDLQPSGLRPPILVTAPGVYLASDTSALYRSTDGLHWTRTVIRPPR